MLSPAVHALPLRVYAADTDASGIVHHAQYLVFAERARTEMLRAHALAADTLSDVDRGYWIVRRADVTYRMPARLDDQLLILTRVVGVRGASCDIEQRATRGHDLLAHMAITVAYVSAQGRPQRAPAEWRERFAALATDAASAW